MAAVAPIWQNHSRLGERHEHLPHHTVQENRHAPTTPFPNRPLRGHRLSRVRLRWRQTTRRPRLQCRPRFGGPSSGQGQPMVPTRPTSSPPTRPLLPPPAHDSGLRRRRTALRTPFPTTITKLPPSEPAAMGDRPDRCTHAPLLERNSLDPPGHRDWPEGLQLRASSANDPRRPGPCVVLAVHRADKERS